MPSGYRLIDANGIVLAHVYGQPDGAIAVSDKRLSTDLQVDLATPQAGRNGAGPEQGQGPAQADRCAQRVCLQS